MPLSTWRRYCPPVRSLESLPRATNILRAMPPRSVLPKFGHPPVAVRARCAGRLLPRSSPPDVCLQASLSVSSAGQVTRTARRPPTDVRRRLGVVIIIHTYILTCTCASRPHGCTTPSFTRRVESRAAVPREVAAQKKSGDTSASQPQRSAGISRPQIRKLACRCAARRPCRSTAVAP